MYEGSRKSHVSPHQTNRGAVLSEVRALNSHHSVNSVLERKRSQMVVCSLRSRLPRDSFHTSSQPAVVAAAASRRFSSLPGDLCPLLLSFSLSSVSFLRHGFSASLHLTASSSFSGSFSCSNIPVSMHPPSLLSARPSRQAHTFLARRTPGTCSSTCLSTAVLRSERSHRAILDAPDSSTTGVGMARVRTTMPRSGRRASLNFSLEGTRTATTWVPVHPLTIGYSELGDLGQLFSLRDSVLHVREVELTSRNET